MQRWFWIAAVTCLFSATQACGDDDVAADGGTDASRSDAGRGGKGGAGGKAGAGGSAGASGSAGKSGAGGSAGGGSVATKAVTIRFKAKINDEDLACGKSFANLGTSKVHASVQDFRFFVEGVKLITSSGDEAPVVFDDKAPFQTKDVALIDFTDKQGTCTAGGATVNTTITGKVAPGDYQGLVFVTGVPETINHQNLTDAKPPLQDASTYWGWASGYRFIMTGLIVDAADRGADPNDADGGVASSGANFVHIGAGGCTGTNTSGFNCTRANRTRIELAEFDAETGTIVADLGKAFEDVDLKAAVECHGPAPECGPVYSAFGLSLDTGTTLDSQKVFRAE
ncbi:MAG TPA: MbnP family copper-binding protein [Polyangiales bacterium]|nr:MbnP family copper-binding protein [Polyangiales bacterium]